MMFGMSPRPDRMFDDSIRAPASIQSLIDGTDGHNAYCGQCRNIATLRCSRCKVAKYCCSQHQKDHFAFHKKHCKSISKQRKLVEDGIKEIDGMPWGVRKGVVPIIHMGDMLVRIGYQESDTLLHGNMYYREASGYYTMPMKFLRDGLHDIYSFVEDKILLMLVALGGDDGAIKSWFEFGLGREGVDRKSLRSGWYDTPMAPGDGDDEKEQQHRHMLHLEGLVQDDKYFHFLYLFNSLKALAACRQYLERINIYAGASREVDSNAPMDDITKNISPYLACSREDEARLSDNINRAIAAFRYHRSERYLIHLCDSIPFSKHHAPGLFRESEKTSMPGPEIWMILQDCFFETQGVRAILDEFLDDEIDHDDKKCDR